MLKPLLLLYAIIAFSLFTLGAVVALKNAKLKLNKLFFAFTSSMALWLISNYFSNDFSKSQTFALIANHLALFFSGIGLLVLLRFTAIIAQNNFILRHDWLWYLGYASVGLTLTPLTVAGIEKQENVYAITFGPLAPVYFMALAGSALGAFAVLAHGIRHTKGMRRDQLLAVFYSLVTAIGLMMITNFIIPVTTGSFALTNVGPLLAIVVVAGLSYSIVRHRLFDIKLVVARALAYLLSLAGIVCMYGLVILAASQTLFQGDSISTARQVFYVTMSVLAGLIAVPLKKFFDKITNRFFYRDAYDAPVFLDQLNKVLVSNIDLEILLDECSRVIIDNLKPSFAVFAVKVTAYSPQRIIGNFEKEFSEEYLQTMRSLTSLASPTVIVIDELDEDSELRQHLQKHEVAVLARLTDDKSKGADAEGISYLLLGPKKSANPYNQQDLKTIEIIANELVIAIQNALRFEEIEKFTETLQEKVDHATKQLRQTNEKLKALDETKDEFISMASHQLRTPLTSVKGYISMVLEGDAGEISEMQRKLLDQAYVSSQRMVYLIADLLNVSRLRTGKFIIEAIPSNLAEVVEGEISQLKDTAAGRGLELTYEKPENFPTLYLDETKIRQVIMNFTDNAIYYTPRGGHITVKLAEKDESIEFTVTDDGMGVPKAEQPHLFTKFYRAFNAKKVRPDGTGLGLFMAKKVIISQGGGLIFKSEEGKGSTFGFSFPKVKLSKPPISPARLQSTSK